MSNFQKILVGLLIVQQLVTIVFCISTAKYTPIDDEVFSDNIWLKQGQHSDSLILYSLNGSDTVTVEQENDLLTFLPDNHGGYIIVSEAAEYNVGAFYIDDAQAFMYWALQHPMPAEDDEYANTHYQSLIEEKIWE